MAFWSHGPVSLRSITGTFVGEDRHFSRNWPVGNSVLCGFLKNIACQAAAELSAVQLNLIWFASNSGEFEDVDLLWRSSVCYHASRLTLFLIVTGLNLTSV